MANNSIYDASKMAMPSIATVPQFIWRIQYSTSTGCRQPLNQANQPELPQWTALVLNLPVPLTEKDKIYSKNDTDLILSISKWEQNTLNGVYSNCVIW